MQPIMQLLDSDPVVRRDAARALCRRGDPSSVPNILLALESETEGEVRFRLVEALGAIGDRRALPALIAGLEDHSEHVRERAALALGVLGEVTDPDPLLRRLADPVRRVRLAAVIALGQLDVDSAYLTPMLQDPEEVVRIAAADELERRR